jgi:hypothetical protein
MFQVFCIAHRSRVLLDARRIEGLHNTTRGPVIAWRCYCGEQGTLLHGVSRPVKAIAAPFRPGSDTTAAALTAPKAA